MKGIVVIVAAITAAAAPAAAQARRPSPLGLIQARNIAGNYAMNNWDPTTLLPSYSQATSWDRVDGDVCFRWSRWRVICSVNVVAENYYYDPIADINTGYAWCDGTLDVIKHGYSIRVFDEQDETCDSTDDYSSGSY